MRLTRRHMLAGLASATATSAWAEAPSGSIRPRPRNPEEYLARLPGGADLVRKTRLPGQVGFAVANARTGEILDSHEPDLPMPPASTAKALTTLWALDRLGADYRYETTAVATGPVTNGRIEGDLILAGGGDPVLDTDDLASVVMALKAQGIREIGGKVRVYTGALPFLHEIDVEQPDHVGYNPAICGLNLNFNRVHFGWERSGNSYSVTMDGRSGNYIPAVEMARMEVIDRSGPVYTYEQSDRTDSWTVARAALGSGGSRWLPVRYPGLYAGEVFQTVARAEGIMTAGPVERADAVEGVVLHTHRSDVLPPLLEDMLRYSTNITAEIMGLTASQTLGPVRTLQGSADRMNAWLKKTYGLRTVSLEDHSGLGDDSRITATDMVRAMVGSGPGGALRPLMKEFALDDRRFQVDAKTGTLNFVSALTGYVSGPSGDPLAFAIFCGDIPRRDALTMAQRERPEGGRGWIAVAKGLQRNLLELWGKKYLL